MIYYSKRNKELSLKLTDEFWEAFKAYINELFESGCFVEFGKWGYEYDYRAFYADNGQVNRKMAQEIGKRLYPLSEIDEKPDDETIFDLIEFFFKYVTKPTGDHIDREKGTYEYTVRINQLFDNFRLKYQLRKGEVEALHSEFFDKLLNELEFDMPDTKAKELIDTARKKFISRKIEEQKIALEKLVDAFQKISLWEDQDTKKSTEKILNKVSNGNQAIIQVLEGDSKELWEIANNFMIRHIEGDKIPINDPDCIEYLFYSYLNALSFIMKKYGFVREKRNSEEDDLPS